jgi:RNA polymerase sigma factor (sigma-70 family)
LKEISNTLADDRQTALLFEEHGRFLWRLSYRMTGCAADADDIIQETFVRALAKPPADRERDWRPWLVRVAVNLGRDLLRQRRRRGYPGPWLPSPATEAYEPVDEAPSPATRYEMIESISFAFLLALEVLTPTQRAALLLLDVFDYSAREAANALGISEVNVRTTHRRARVALEAYESNRGQVTLERKNRALQALQQFTAYVAAGDVEGLKSLLAAEVRALTDGGGEFHASLNPIIGPDHLSALFIGLSKKSEPVVKSELKVLNGLPALLVERLPKPGFASKLFIQADVDHAGKITEIYVVLASRKLTAIA